MFAHSLSLFLSLFLFPLISLSYWHHNRRMKRGRWGRFLKRGEGGGLQGFCSVSRNLLTPLAGAQRLGGGGDARQVEEVSWNWKPQRKYTVKNKQFGERERRTEWTTMCDSTNIRRERAGFTDRVGQVQTYMDTGVLSITDTCNQWNERIKRFILCIYLFMWALSASLHICESHCVLVSIVLFFFCLCTVWVCARVFDCFFECVLADGYDSRAEAVIYDLHICRHSP